MKNWKVIYGLTSITKSSKNKTRKPITMFYLAILKTPKN